MNEKYTKKINYSIDISEILEMAGYPVGHEFRFMGKAGEYSVDDRKKAFADWSWHLLKREGSRGLISSQKKHYELPNSVEQFKYYKMLHIWYNLMSFYRDKTEVFDTSIIDEIKFKMYEGLDEFQFNYDKNEFNEKVRKTFSLNTAILNRSMINNMSALVNLIETNNHIEELIEHFKQTFSKLELKEDNKVLYYMFLKRYENYLENRLNNKGAIYEKKRTSY